MSYSDHLRNTPSKSQKAALRGTKGTPSATNRYVTDIDPRLGANPTNHHTTHEPGGDDIIELLKLHDTNPAAVSPLPSPMVNAAWLYRTGASPEEIEIHAYIDGILYTFSLGGTSAAPDYLHYREEQAQNTAGGTFTSGSWQTRTLNTEVSDSGNHGSLSSNQLTLDAGTYYAIATAPAFECDRHQLRLQNVTDAVTVLLGQSNQSGNTDSITVYARLSGQFTIAASKALELQHQCLTTKATTGFGVAANFTTEIYSVVEFWKLA